MAPQEFQKLSYDLVPALEKDLKEKNKEFGEVKVIQDNMNFNNSLLIGISPFKGSKDFEVYEVVNNGNVAQWHFRGNTTIR